MNVEFGSDTEQRIKERIRTGKYATPADVLLAGLQLLDEREQSRTDQLTHVRRQVFTGLEQLDRGEGLDGEQVFADLLAELDEPHDPK